MDEAAGLDTLAGPSTAIIPDDAYRHRLRNVIDRDDSQRLSDDEVQQEDATAEVEDDDDDEKENRFDEDFGSYEAGPSVSSGQPIANVSCSTRTSPQTSTPASPGPSIADTNGSATPSRKRTSLIHPSISRLRSHFRSDSSSSGLVPAPVRPGHSRVVSNASATSFRSGPSFSKASSALGSEDLEAVASVLPSEGDRASVGSRTRGYPELSGFSFRTLKRASTRVFADDRFGEPTVMCARSLIVIGTDQGEAIVLNYRQDVVAVCRSISSPVSALDISHDQTFIAVGHADGSIFLYDLKDPSVPARSASALPFAALASGRKEGHLENMPITHIRFVGTRHTAIVSGDASGRCFWRSMGKVLGIESTDVIRLHGRMVDESESSPSTSGSRRTPLFAALPCPPSEGPPDKVDGLSLNAILTHNKLLIIGLRPKPRTWHRSIRNRTLARVHVGAADWHRDSRTRLAHSWGRSVRLLTLIPPADEGSDIEFRDAPAWQCPEDVVALKWYDGDHLLVQTASSLYLYNLPEATIVESAPCDALDISLYKGKIFLLHSTCLRLATLRLWADKILFLVHSGDFLAAIRLIAAYYLDLAPGNRIGIPDHDQARHDLMLPRIRSLLESALTFTFSEERLTDRRYMTPGFGGVDLQPLFQQFARTALDTCCDLGDMTFAYEEVYEAYQRNGIEGIFLDELFDLLLDSQIPSLDPALAQALLLHVAHDDRLEYVIQHIEPESLDLNTAVQICTKRQLWDSVIYLYNICFLDYVSPLVRLVERLESESRRLYAYLEMTLTGCQYPHGRPLEPAHRATQAKRDIYDALFSDVGGETRLEILVQYDAETMLHVLDLALEDAHLDEQDTRGLASRQYLLGTLIDIGRRQSQEVRTFVNIFVARNLPKYPQYLHLHEDTTHDIMKDLCEDDDPSTFDDRQLAVETLLSSYRPDADEIDRLFRQAGFWALLRDMHLRRREWTEVIRAYQHLPESAPLFITLEDALRSGSATSSAIEASLELLLRTDLGQTALLIDRNVPALHNKALEYLEDNSERAARYLTALLVPQTMESAIEGGLPSPDSPSTRLPPAQYERFIELHASDDYITFIKSIKTQDANVWSAVADACERLGLLDGLVLSLKQLGQPDVAHEKIRRFAKSQTDRLSDLDRSDSSSDDAVERTARQLAVAVRSAIEIGSSDDQQDELWTDLLVAAIGAQDVLHSRSKASPASKDLTLATKLLLQSSETPFSRLFEKTLDALPPGGDHQSAHIRSVLQAMIDVSSSEASTIKATIEILRAENHIVLADLLARRVAGWLPVVPSACDVCEKSLLDVEILRKLDAGKTLETEALGYIMLSRSGRVRHEQCIA